MDLKSREALGFSAIIGSVCLVAGIAIGGAMKSTPDLEAAQAQYDKLIAESAQMEAKLEYLPELNGEILKRHETLQDKETALIATERAILTAEQRLQSLQGAADHLHSMLDSISEVEQQALTIASTYVKDGAHSISWDAPVGITRTIYPELEMVIYTHSHGQNVLNFSDFSEQGLANMLACIEDSSPCLSMTAMRFSDRNGFDYDWDAQLVISWDAMNNKEAEVIHFHDFDAGAAETLTSKSQDLRAKAIAQQ